MTEYILAHAGDERERERLALLERFHGPLTIAQLEPLVRSGWNCLDAGAGGGGMTAWVAEHVAPCGSVLAVDLETHWLERLRSPVIDVRALDVTTDKLPSHAFDLVLARCCCFTCPTRSQLAESSSQQRAAAQRSWSRTRTSAQSPSTARPHSRPTGCEP